MRNGHFGSIRCLVFASMFMEVGNGGIWVRNRYGFNYRLNMSKHVGEVGIQFLFLLGHFGEIDR